MEKEIARKRKKKINESKRERKDKIKREERMKKKKGTIKEGINEGEK